MKHSAVAIIGALIAMGVDLDTGKRHRLEAYSKPARPCLHCGNMHSHNNAYCSAGCCKAHRAAAAMGVGE